MAGRSGRNGTVGRGSSASRPLRAALEAFVGKFAERSSAGGADVSNETRESSSCVASSASCGGGGSRSGADVPASCAGRGRRPMSSILGPRRRKSTGRGDGGSRETSRPTLGGRRVARGLRARRSGRGGGGGGRRGSGRGCGRRRRRRRGSMAEKDGGKREEGRNQGEKKRKN